MPLRRRWKSSLHEAGMPQKLSLEKVYRESRVVKPPHSWDKEILESFDMWVKQANGPVSRAVKREDPPSSEGISGKWQQLRDQLKSKFTSLNRKSPAKQSRDRKLSSSHN